MPKMHTGGYTNKGMDNTIQISKKKKKILHPQPFGSSAGTYMEKESGKR